MNIQKFKFSLQAILLGFVLISSCKKEDDVIEDELIAVAKAGQLTCKIDGKIYTHNGSGYVIDDNHSTVKAENGSEQFSINFYGMNEGDYTISDGAKATGNVKLQYFSGEDKVVYTVKSGTFNITKYQKTGGFKASGTFSGKFEKFINNTQPTGTTIEVTDGSFTDITLFDVR